MNLQALLVSSDDSAADVLGRVLSGFSVATDRSSDPETALARIQQQKFDALVVDFDNPTVAEPGNSTAQCRLSRGHDKSPTNSEQRRTFCAL
jgi:CheY-like chemotaxis protein